MLVFFMLGCSPNNIFKERNVHQLGVEEYLTKISETENYYIIDVRTPMEYKKNHLDSAINVSFIGLNFQKGLEKLDTSKHVFIYCETAHRSPYAAKVLKKNGFHEIVDLKGGFKAYKKSLKEKQVQD